MTLKPWEPPPPGEPTVGQNITVTKALLKGFDLKTGKLDSKPAGLVPGTMDPNRFLLGGGIQFTTDTAVLQSTDGYLKAALHEMGHALGGVGDDGGKNGSSVMNQFNQKDDALGNIPMTLPSCDVARAKAAKFRR